MAYLPKRSWNCFLLPLVVGVLQPIRGVAQSNTAGSRASSQGVAAPRDGQHDFDFEFGTYKVHIARLVHPLTGSTTWTTYDGTHTVRKVWDGRANIGELEVDGPTGHIEGVSLRLYNAQSHQWNFTYSNSRDAMLGQPTAGEFRDGRGEFYDQETFNGRAVLARTITSVLTPTSYRDESAFSTDGGKTWEVNWVMTCTLMKR